MTSGGILNPSFRPRNQAAGSGEQTCAYVSGTVDQEFGFSSTMNIPIQAALPSGDFVSLQEAQTFWGTALGVDVRGPNGWTVGVKGFYQASADINYTGGTAYVKIPLNYTPQPAFAARY